MTWAVTSPFDPASGAALVEPAALRSNDGEVQVRLEAAEGPVRVAGRQASTLGYNGGLPGPTLHLRPGDRLRVQLVNRLSAPTNLHVHGLHVSPQGNGDNPFVRVDPGESFDYVYRLPEDHPPGVYWYHPHHHGTVADQIFGGLYGAIIIGDPEPMPITRERVLVISDITLDGAGRIRPASTMARMMGREGELVLVNGQASPRLTAHPGERERWRIVNACTARYLRQRLDGQQLQLLGMDSGRLPSPRDVEEIVLAPGNRADLVVTTGEGTSQLRALPYNRGGMMGMGRGRGSGDGPGMQPARAPGAARRAPPMPVARSSPPSNVTGSAPVDGPTWQDVVNVPARSDVKVRVAFDTFGGRTVYHWHILDHEDNGMMGVISAR